MNKLSTGTKLVIHLMWVASFFCLLVGCQNSETPLDGKGWATRMAESVMARNPEGYGKWDYVTGTVLKGFERLWKTTGNQAFEDYIVKTVDPDINEDGAIVDYEQEKYNIDMVNEGRILLFLYQQTGEEKYKKAADLLRKQLADQPRTDEGGFWHKKRYPYQMWLDGLYMGSPFYVEYGLLFNQPENFDDVVNQFVYMENHARDEKTGLLYHGWDEKKVQEWANPETGLSQCFWGRGMGWYGMALVDVLDYLPQDYEGRSTLIDNLRRVADAMVGYQDKETGVWWQVLDQAGREGNYLEASASNMFVYTLAKGVRKGYLDSTYLPAIEFGYRGILKQFITENEDGTINLIEICKSAGLGYGRDGSFHYYAYEEPRVMNDGKGVGPFIMASLEISQLFN